MTVKRDIRARRAKKTRYKLIGSGAENRLQVFKTNSHIYAQILDSGSKVIVSASSLDPDMRKDLGNGGNVSAAAKIGSRIGLKAKEKGLEKVAFDRSGFKYHGRIKALAEAAREAGLKF
jgi:large subunit ribosomal protein L18